MWPGLSHPLTPRKQEKAPMNSKRYSASQSAPLDLAVGKDGLPWIKKVHGTLLRLTSINKPDRPPTTSSTDTIKSGISTTPSYPSYSALSLASKRETPFPGPKPDRSSLDALKYPRKKPGKGVEKGRKRQVLRVKNALGQWYKWLLWAREYSEEYENKVHALANYYSIVDFRRAIQLGLERLAMNYLERTEQAYLSIPKGKMHLAIPKVKMIMEDFEQDREMMVDEKNDPFNLKARNEAHEFWKTKKPLSEKDSLFLQAALLHVNIYLDEVWECIFVPDKFLGPDEWRFREECIQESPRRLEKKLLKDEVYFYQGLKEFQNQEDKTGTGPSFLRFRWYINEADMEKAERRRGDHLVNSLV